MNRAIQNQEKKRPVSRKFWNYLNCLPRFIQAGVIRHMFEIDYDLSQDLVFKQAETEQEIREALKIVHDCYVELDYIDPTQSGLRFSKYQSLPTAMTLVAKVQNEVIGTVSIIPDSAMGLPSDMTWSLEKYRKKGLRIAEVSALSIKKGFRGRRGKLFLPMMKTLLLYLEQILKIDGVVIATAIEVEPFYEHILLFEKVTENSGQQHHFVKGKSASCCFQYLNSETRRKVQKTYSHRPLKKNLFHFLYEIETPNIQLPSQKAILQSYTLKQSLLNAKLIRENPELLHGLSRSEGAVIKNLDIYKTLDQELKSDFTQRPFQTLTTRYSVSFQSQLFESSLKNSLRCLVVDLSENGFKLKLQAPPKNLGAGDKVLLLLENGDGLVCVNASIIWWDGSNTMGCEILEKTDAWSRLMEHLHSEFKNSQKIEFKNAA